jgi:hypothetical protein
VIWDFRLVGGSATNLTFPADTYLIANTVNLYGTTVLEGGAVLKYTNATAAKVICHGEVVCNTTRFAPVVFTSMHDDTCGEAITGSTGNPETNYCANPALELRTAGQNLHDLLPVPVHRIAKAGRECGRTASSSGDKLASGIRGIVAGLQDVSGINEGAG